MDSPLLTIIIATYNSEKTLRKALQSVEDQTFQDWECLVVDGYSKDDTIKIVNEFVEKDARFRYISEPDNGIYDAFNKGWKNARGEWVHYLGSDDRLTQDGIEALMKIKYTDEAILSGASYLILKDGTIKKIESVGYGGNHQAKLTRRKYLEEMGGYDTTYSFCADTDMHIRLKNKGYKVINIPVPIAYYSMTGASSAISNQLVLLKERYHIYKKDKEVNYPLLKAFCISGYGMGTFIFRALLRKIKMK